MADQCTLLRRLSPLRYSWTDRSLRICRGYFRSHVPILDQSSSRALRQLHQLRLGVAV